LRATGCGKTPPAPPGTSVDEIVLSDHILRRYLLHIPLTYQDTRPTPLVLSFHGHGSSAWVQERLSGFSTLADRADFLVAYPQGTIGPDGKTGWATGPAKDPKVDDVSFVARLLTQVQSMLCVDAARIYASGFSNGGAMTTLLACKLSGRIAAFASVSGSYFPVAGGCQPGRPVPLLEIHGTGDFVVPYYGSAQLDLPPVTEWLAQWATRDGCTQGPLIFWQHDLVTGVHWTDCRGNVQVEHYRLSGGGHTWPRLIAVPGTTPAASTAEVIWAFLKNYALSQSAAVRHA
jgi:polyhydroxybutyrate depolymerase